MNIIHVESQYIHYMVKPKDGVEFGCIFVYGFNDAHSRMLLWSGLRSIARNPSKSWVLMGDFHALSNIEDRISYMVIMAEVRQ